MLDLDRAIAERALARKLVSEGELTRCEKLLAERRAGGAKTYLAQVLVQEHLLDPKTLVELQDDLGAAIYECPKCSRRHSAIELGGGRAFPCKGCGQEVKLRAADRGFSQVEVLASRDPRDLSVTLRLAEDSSASLGKVSEVDLTRYQVEGELGRGGYGVVFQANDRQMDRRVALKVLKAANEISNTTLERFIREGRAASKLKHPNICQVYDIGRSKDVVALAMELVKGTSLKDRVLAGALPWKEACEIQLGILAGVQHAHEHGVIHRDLKPANVILEEATGRPILIDFGLAKDVQSNAELTGAGQILGTPFYLAPEQVEGRSNQVDARSDVFALGVMFYEALAGRRPFLSKARNEVYWKILHEEPPPPSEVVPELPECFDPVVKKALAKKPEDRFASAKEFADSIRAALVTAEDPKTPKKPKKPARPLARSAARRVPSDSFEASRKGSSVAAHGAIAAAGILVAVIAIVLMRSPPRPPETVAETPPPAPALTPPPPVPAPAPPAPAPPASVPTPPAPPGPPSPPAPPPPPPVEQTPPSQPDPEVVPGPAPQTPPVPEPAAVAPVNSALALDDGSGDDREFKSLNEKTEPDWVVRAFATNAFAEGPRTAESVRALRYALLDREPLVRAFALRGLTRRAIDDLRAWGSQALFERLVANLGVKAGVLPYVSVQARKVLAALAGKDLGETAEPWRAWWKSDGAPDFLAVRAARPAQAPPLADEAAPRSTQEKEAARYLTQAREQGLDAVLCIDVTLSMTEMLARVKSQIRELTSFFKLLGREAKVPVHLGFVTYGDEVVKCCPFLENLNDFARAIDQVEIFNDPNDHTVEEGPDKAIKKCVTDAATFKWRPKARKVIVVVGDAPMHPEDEKDCYAFVKEQSKKKGFSINTLACEPPPKYRKEKWLPYREFKDLADLTGGVATELKQPEEVITQLLVLLLGSRFEDDVRRFVFAYREVVPPG